MVPRSSYFNVFLPSHLLYQILSLFCDRVCVAQYEKASICTTCHRLHTDLTRVAHVLQDRNLLLANIQSRLGYYCSYLLTTVGSREEKQRIRTVSNRLISIYNCAVNALLKS